MGACCVYLTETGELVGDCRNIFPPGCEDHPDPRVFYEFFPDTNCESQSLLHPDGNEWWHGCATQTYACCLVRGECTFATPEGCIENHDGVTNRGATSCDPDPCIHACCLPDGSCNNSRVTWCRDMDGEIKWDQNCADNPCPVPPKPCCLCRGQCKMTSEGECSILGGVWQETLPNCETAAGQCGNINVQMRCRQSRFVMTKDTLQDPTRYRPISRDTMDPHEYQRGVAGNNCRQWWGNVSVTKGAWGCGQWNKDDQSTLRNFKIHMKIDPVTGLGSRWAKYRPVCPEYT